MKVIIAAQESVLVVSLRLISVDLDLLKELLEVTKALFGIPQIP